MWQLLAALPEMSVHSGHRGDNRSLRLFEDLVQFNPEPTPSGNFKPIDEMGPATVLDAQVATADWLEEIGAPPDEDAHAEATQKLARAAFTAMITDSDEGTQRKALTTLKTPEAVRHITGMLAAYDWEFVEQAKELRGYAVAQIFEETKHPDAKIRLKALEMLGKVTEVALFTERVEVKKAEMSDHELEAKIKEKLNKFMKVVDVVDVRDVSEDTPAEPTPTEINLPKPETDDE